ncbi:unnamed protein product [Cyprideis torosa]|uniref:adenosylhomocysteine nucleosidase n=1 Tax=Cyprideis torosa TaxID=163714 RepID=A0A7R8WUH6_9CRUS|nr:unnamed protein product [Cyprideis torosa]CAG0910334.1 unnamed protein product [Cyprideis torosa]
MVENQAPTKPSLLGLMGAMESEVTLLRETMEVRQTHRHGGVDFYSGTLLQRPVVLCQSGVGKVLSAACAQLLADRFGISDLIFTGVAGALDPALDVGDLVIGDDTVQHDMDASALGFAPGIVPFTDEGYFKADPQWIDCAVRAAERLGFPFRRGRILSGDRFISSPEECARLRDAFDGTCTEMEGAAVAHICQRSALAHRRLDLFARFAI